MKKKVVLKMNDCRVCGSGYGVFLYHEKNKSNKIKVGSNCACAKSEISEDHVSDLRDELLHPERYAPTLFGPVERSPV